MRTYDLTIDNFIITPEEMEDFFEDLDCLCKKHGLSISHEDSEGSFVIEKYKEENMEWLKCASKGYEDD